MHTKLKREWAIRHQYQHKTRMAPCYMCFVMLCCIVNVNIYGCNIAYCTYRTCTTVCRKIYSNCFYLWACGRLYAEKTTENVRLTARKIRFKDFDYVCIVTHRWFLVDTVAFFSVQRLSSICVCVCVSVCLYISYSISHSLVPFILQLYKTTVCFYPIWNASKVNAKEICLAYIMLHTTYAVHDHKKLIVFIAYIYAKQRIACDRICSIVV